MSKVYSLDTYRELSKRFKKNEIVGYELFNQEDLDNHFKNCDFLRGIIRPEPVIEAMKENQNVNQIL